MQAEQLPIEFRKNVSEEELVKLPIKEYVKHSITHDRETLFCFWKRKKMPDIRFHDLSFRFNWRFCRDGLHPGCLCHIQQKVQLKASGDYYAWQKVSTDQIDEWFEVQKKTLLESLKITKNDLHVFIVGPVNNPEHAYGKQDKGYYATQADIEQWFDVVWESPWTINNSYSLTELRNKVIVCKVKKEFQ